MKKLRWVLVALLAATLAVGATACGGGGSDKNDRYEDYVPGKTESDAQFDFEGNYQAPELTIDGVGDDAQWQAIKTPLATFGRNGGASATVKVYRGEKAIFFLFEVRDTVLLTQGTTNDNAVTRGDSIELYLDTKADGGSYPQADDFQINLGIHGKTRIMQGAGHDWGSWNGLVDYEVKLNGILNDGIEPLDSGYTIEVMIPYSQILIEKEDTIAIAFGLVDKVGLGDSSSGNSPDYTWNGWSFGGKMREPQTPDNYVMLDKDNALWDRTAKPVLNATVAGLVRDHAGDPVEGADVTLTDGGKSETAQTDAAGRFAFPDIVPEKTYYLTVEKADYITVEDSYTREELIDAEGGEVVHNIVLLKEGEVVMTTVTGTVKNVADGAISGATVAVKGGTATATTAADGTFTLENVPANAGAVTLTVTKGGYADDCETVIAANKLKPLETTELGDVNLNLPWANGGVFASGSNKGANYDKFVNATVRITRTLTGVLFRFDGSRPLDGKIEIYLDTKECGATREVDRTAWRFDLKVNDIEVIRYGSGDGTTVPSVGVVYTVTENSSKGYHSTVLIPYDFLDIEPLEVFGIELGQHSDSANDWDGWGWEGGGVRPEEPAKYIRVGARNNLYRDEVNGNQTIAEFSGNVGHSGITVTVGERRTVSAGDGSWSLRAPVSQDAITVTYSGVGYVTATTTIPAGYFGTHSSWSENKELEARTVTVTGLVTGADETPLQGVDVQLEGGENAVTTVSTGSDGKYTFTGVKTFGELTLTFTKTGYLEGTLRIPAADLANTDAYTAAAKALTPSAEAQEITLTGSVRGVEGGLVGATLKVQGGVDILATTVQDGAFTVPAFQVADCTLVVEMTGYLPETVNFSADSVSGSTFALGEIFLAREYTALGGAFGAKSDFFAHFIPSVTRGKDAFEFDFTGSKPFAGHIELFVDTKISAANNKRNATDYRFNLDENGSVAVENWGGPNTDNTTLKLTVTEASSETPKAHFTLPYAFLGVARDEIIGVSFGQWSTTANENKGDFDGWSVDSMKGADGAGYVRPEMPSDYIRIGADNTPFCNMENIPAETFDFTGYNVHFGFKMDNFHAKITRSGKSLQIEFVTLGDFGTSENPDNHTVSDELILIYLNTKAERQGAWDVSYQFKINANCEVFGGEGAWPPADEAHKRTASTCVKSEGDGYVKYTFTVSAEDFDIGEEEMGITFVEGWKTRDNYSTEYSNGCVLLGVDTTGGYFVPDAANSLEFIRLGADGSLKKPS